MNLWTKSSICCLIITLCAACDPNPSSPSDNPPVSPPSASDHIVRLSQTNSQEARCAVELTDGGLAMGGVSRTRDLSSWNILILRISPSGNTQWVQEIPCNEFGWATGICETTDGNIMVTAADGDSDKQERRSLLIRLDAAGNILWQKTFWGQGNLNLCCLDKTQDGHFLIGGGAVDFMDDGTVQTPLYVLKADGQGEILWEKRYTAAHTNAWLNAIRVYDERIVAFGEGSWDQPDDWQGIMVSLTHLGELTWINTFGHAEGNEEAYGLCGSSEQGFIGSGHAPYPTPGRGYAALIDASGELEWKISIDSCLNIPCAVDYGSGRTLLQGGSSGQVLSMLIDSDGETLWTTRVGMPSANLDPRTLLVSRRGGFISCGTLIAGQESDLFFLRLDASAAPQPF